MRRAAFATFVLLLVAACSSVPVPLDQPLVVAFEWKPADTDVSTSADAQIQLAQRNESLRLFFEQQFESHFRGDVSFVAPSSPNPNRVELTVSELARQRTATMNNPYPRDVENPNEKAVAQRCGDVEYVVFVDDREAARRRFPLDCGGRPNELPGVLDRTGFDDRGFADYEKAAVRAATEVAKALRSAGT